MCGFVGALVDDSLNIIDKNLSLLQKRGPDSNGILTFDNGMTLGATRLAMTDPLDRSNQPMVDDQSGNVILFNGEIYNYKLIKSILLRKNISLNTDSDTEVLLQSLIHFGLDFITNFEGMFSFAYYDKWNSKIVLARDFLGKKPLYYSLLKNGFAFSSQVNVVKKFLNSTSLNQDSISMYLGLGYIIDPITMFNEVHSVEPGEVLILDIKSRTIQEKYRFIPKSISSPTEQDLVTSLNSAIKQRVQGHESFALSLSGGVDSNLLLLQCLELGLNVKPFVVSWPYSDKNSYNQDSIAAKKVASKLRIDLKTVEFPGVEKVPEILHEYLKSISSPNSNPTAISMMYLYSELKRSGHNLVLTGDGADEIFGGYARYKNTNRFNFVPRINNETIKNYMIDRRLKHNAFQKLAHVLTPSDQIQSWLFWHLIADRQTVSKIFRELPQAKISALDFNLSKVFSVSTRKVKQLMFRDLMTWLPMESNRKLDSISMYHSIEARSPFQDENVISCGYRQMDESDFKHLNKEILLSTFPKLNTLPLNTKKAGFISPLGSWLRSNQELIDDSLRSLGKFFEVDRSEIELLRQSPKNKDYHSFKFLWSLIVLEGWLSENF